MLRWLLVGFLIAHGLVHFAVWGASASAKAAQGTDADHSWLIGDQHSVAAALTWIVTVLFVAAGMGLAFHIDAWETATLIAAIASLVLIALFPEAMPGAWPIAPISINIALIAAVLWAPDLSERLGLA